MFQRILVPLDGSEESTAAVPVAAELGRRLGAALLLLEMVPTADAHLGLAADVASGALTDPTLYGAEVSAREQAAEGYVAAVADELAAQGLDVSYSVGVGSESAGVVEAVRAQGVDLVVIAAHTRSGLGRLFGGSAVDGILRAAGVPVLAVPPGPRPEDE